MKLQPDVSNYSWGICRYIEKCRFFKTLLYFMLDPRDGGLPAHGVTSRSERSLAVIWHFLCRREPWNVASHCSLKFLMPPCTKSASKMCIEIWSSTTEMSIEIWSCVTGMCIEQVQRKYAEYNDKAYWSMVQCNENMYWNMIMCNKNVYDIWPSVTKTCIEICSSIKKT